MTEALGVSPFVGHADDTLELLTSAGDTVYLGNPNWVTGANFSVKDIERLAAAIPDGLLIVDEKYFDFYGISALPLLQQYGNVMILRSLTSGFGIDHDASGFVVSSPERTEQLRNRYDWSGLSRTLMTILSTILVSADALSQRLALIHNEALRVAKGLTELGVQNRMTSADFLLLRVADPIRVGNFLARSNAAPENLEGYPGLEKYIRYRLQSPLSNDSFLSAFGKMPREYYHLDNLDRRAVLLHRPADRGRSEAVTATQNRLHAEQLQDEAMETGK
jgi:histidinol-phosphate aminotransferase